MGKASKWFRAVLGLKKVDSSPSQPPKQLQREKRRWSFVKSYREKDALSAAVVNDFRHDAESEKHAIAVAAATAAVAEAAVAAAQAAAAVVRLTSSGRCISASGAAELEELAAVKIQSTFRGYLARRALRALKGLVKIQALVRGHIARKHQREKMRRMQAMFRVQARARVERSQLSESSQSSSKSSHFQHPIQDPATPEKFEQYVRVNTTNRDHSPLHRRNGSRSIGKSIVYQERVRTILEVDTLKPRHRTHGSTLHEPCSGEVQSLSPLKFPHEVEDGQFNTADNSPLFLSASSRGGSCRRSPFTTPTKSDGSRSFLSAYSDHPNYMSVTESSKAKVRSLSAPRQRPQIEKSGSIKRFSIHGYGEPRQRVASSLQAVSFASRAYPGSGRLDRLGMPQGRGEGLGYGY